MPQRPRLPPDPKNVSCPPKPRIVKIQGPSSELKYSKIYYWNENFGNMRDGDKQVLLMRWRIKTGVDSTHILLNYWVEYLPEHIVKNPKGKDPLLERGRIVHDKRLIADLEKLIAASDA